MLPKFGKTYSNLFIKMCPLLSVRFYSIILYSVFNEHFLPWDRSLEVVGSSGLEPPTSRLSGARSNHLSYEPIKLFGVSLHSRLFAYSLSSPSGVELTVFVSAMRLWLPALPVGGDDGIRTHDPLLAGQVLSQLSYTPIFFGVPFPGH